MSYKIKTDQGIFPVVFDTKLEAESFGEVFFAPFGSGTWHNSVESWIVIKSDEPPAYTFRDGRLVRI
jgi:hypothetical protein